MAKNSKIKRKVFPFFTKKYWTFKAIDRNDGELLAYECGDRTIETISRLYEK